MNIKDVVQTTVFICCLVMIPVLGLAYYLYTQSGLEHSEVLDKSFGVMIGVFGGSATLAAAYIASKLFNDWRKISRFDVAQKTLSSLMRLKSHIDKNYQNAKFHLDSYSLENQPNPPSDRYIYNRINDAKNSEKEKKEFKEALNILLIDFYEQVDFYEITTGVTLIEKEDKGFNFNNFMFFISHMYTCAYEGQLKDIDTCNQLAKTSKENFENNYYNILFTKIKEDVSLWHPLD